MFKNIIVGLINKVFGLNLTVNDLDTIIAFIELLSGVFGGKSEAVSYMARTRRKAASLSKAAAKAKFEGLEKTLVE